LHNLGVWLSALVRPADALPVTKSPVTAPAASSEAVRAEAWLKDGLDGRFPKTIKENQNVLEPLQQSIGHRKLRELSAADVRTGLTGWPSPTPELPSPWAIWH
jgi:hypothetical protein